MPMQEMKEAGHSHAHVASANSTMLKWALVLTTVYLFAEVAGGVYFNSLALLSDAAHMLTDVAALVIALMAIAFGKKSADNRRTFGYRRFEILAAAFNAVLLVLVAIYVLIEAIKRFASPEAVQTKGMLVVAVTGLVVNFISMRLLMAGKEESFNIKSAYLEVWADMIGSAGVIGGALLIRWTGWTWIDAVVAVGIGLWVLPRTWVLLRDTTNVLLEGVPKGVDLHEIRATIQSVDGVKTVHDLHVWSMSNDDISCTAHVRVGPGMEPADVRKEVAESLHERFNILHSTIQVEDPGEDCPGRGANHP
jgi:cobalt-zinc-cadmium efflux system protein